MQALATRGEAGLVTMPGLLKEGRAGKSRGACTNRTHPNNKPASMENKHHFPMTEIDCLGIHQKTNEQV